MPLVLFWGVAAQSLGKVKERKWTRFEGAENKNKRVPQNTDERETMLRLNNKPWWKRGEGSEWDETSLEMVGWSLELLQKCKVWNQSWLCGSARLLSIYLFIYICLSLSSYFSLRWTFFYLKLSSSLFLIILFSFLSMSLTVCVD